MFWLNLGHFGKRALTFLLAMLTLLTGVHPATAQGTAFTYQGLLSEGGSPANGNYDFAFALYNDPLSGSQVGPTATNTAISVTNGLFTTTLDFGSAPWNGQSLWLQILVSTNGGGVFSPMTPRQPLTRSPYAIQSLNATTATIAATAAMATTANSANSVAATNVSGTIPNAALPSSPVFSGTITANSFSGDGAGLTGLNGSNIILAGGNLFLGPAGNSTLTGILNTGTGTSALASVTTGSYNVAYGPYALSLLTVANYATAIGYAAGANNVNGADITAIGSFALTSNTSGTDISAFGNGALADNTSGSFNVAVGHDSQNLNMTGAQNDSLGYYSLFSNTASWNTAIGFESMLNNVTGEYNTAVGHASLNKNTNGYDNVAVGAYALGANSNANYNVGVGFESLYNNINGSQNVAVGMHALLNDTSGANNIAIGYQAGSNIVKGGGNIDIGASGTADETNITRIGNFQTITYIAGVAVVSNGFASYNTNVLTATAATSWSGQFITIGYGFTNTYGTNGTYYYNGTEGSAIYYRHGGAGGGTVAANPIITNTITTAGGSFHLAANDGVQIVSGSGTNCYFVFGE